MTSATDDFSVFADTKQKIRPLGSGRQSQTIASNRVRDWQRQQQLGELPPEIVGNDMMRMTQDANGRIFVPPRVSGPPPGTTGDAKVIEQSTTLSVNSAKAKGEYVIDVPASSIRNVASVEVKNVSIPNPYIRIAALNSVIYFKYLVQKVSDDNKQAQDYDSLMFTDCMFKLPDGDYLATDLVEAINSNILKVLSANSLIDGSDAAKVKLVFARDTASLQSAYNVTYDASSQPVVYSKRQDATVRFLNASKSLSVLVPSLDMVREAISKTYGSGKSVGAIWSTLGFPLDRHARVIRGENGRLSNVPTNL